MVRMVPLHICAEMARAALLGLLTASAALTCCSSLLAPSALAPAPLLWKAPPLHGQTAAGGSIASPLVLPDGNLLFVPNFPLSG